jgi:threonine/homoserine/homoserine lactone efflux protein
VKLCGAAYLVWLGVQAIRHRASLASSSSDVPPGAPNVHGDWHAVRQGFLVGVANPKAFIIFASVLPQFVDRGAGHVPLQMLELSLVAFVMALVCDSCWGLAAATVRSWFARSPRRTGLVGAAGGASMIGLGVTLAVTGRPRD